MCNTSGPLVSDYVQVGMWRLRDFHYSTFTSWDTIYGVNKHTIYEKAAANGELCSKAKSIGGRKIQMKPQGRIILGVLE